ncbi:MAG: hypothetical protein ACFB20_07250 [Opitutales bacterium]
MRPRFHRCLKAVVVGPLCLILSGCIGFGPRTIPRDGLNFATAIETNWKEQTLLNMVKLRYGDVPVFVEVSSVITQYTLERELAFNTDFRVGPGNDAAGIDGKGRFIDRPTITYTPLLGEEFSRSLLTPIPPAVLFALIQARWRSDLIFRGVVRSINQTQNASSSRLEAMQRADVDFLPLIRSLQRIQEAGAIGLRKVRKENGEEHVMLYFLQDCPEDILQEIDHVRLILGLRPDAWEFRLTYGAAPADDLEIAILSRSILEVMVAMAETIEVPEEDVQTGRAELTMTQVGPDGEFVPPLLTVRSGVDRPKDAFVDVFYGGHWFWIENTDLPSKRAFSFVMILFSLAQTSGSGRGPTLTLPTG